jgi:hypothetical protein
MSLQSTDPIAQTARYLTRKDPQNETRFPRLFSISRNRPAKKQSASPDPI